MLARLVFTLATLLGLLRAAQPFTMYVSKGGSDGAGNGTFAKPYLTIQAAITAIANTGTAAQPWAIVVSSGTFASAFALDPFEFIVGTGRNATIISNPAANWLSANFSAAGTQDAGIINATIGAALTVNFSSVVSPAGRFFLTNCLINGVALSFTGNTVSNLASVFGCQKVLQGPVATHTFTNVVYFLSHCNLRNDNITTDSTTATFTVNPFITQVYTAGTVTFAAAAGVATNPARIHLSQDFEAANRIVITGDSIVVSGATFYQVTAPDADTTFQLDQVTVGATKLISGGNNLITANPTANRAFTFGLASSIGFGSRVRLKNQSAFVISLSFVDPSTGDATYVGPFGFVEMFFANGAWNVFNPEPQFGSVQLAAGVSALVATDITAQSVIVATLKTFAGPIGSIQAKGTDRVVGTRAGGGGFKLTSIDPAAGTTVITDTSTYDWMVMRP